MVDLLIVLGVITVFGSFLFSLCYLYVMMSNVFLKMYHCECFKIIFSKKKKGILVTIMQVNCFIH